MHCPTCGQPATTDQLFCRQCGMNLLMVGQLVAQHAGDAKDKISQRKCEEDIIRRMFSWMLWGMMVLGIGVAMLVGTKHFVVLKWYSPEVTAWLRLISTAVVLGGTGMTAFGLLNFFRQGAALSGGRSSKAISEPVDTKKLPTNPIPASLPSITERTTQLIPAETVKPELEAK